MSSVVYALFAPPAASIVRSNIFGPYFFEPLNIMCSKKCEIPVMPGTSLREPTFQNKYMLALGIEASSSTMIFMPLSSVKLLMSSAVVACAWLRGFKSPMANTRADSVRFILFAPCCKYPHIEVNCLTNQAQEAYPAPIFCKLKLYRSAYGIMH